MKKKSKKIIEIKNLSFSFVRGVKILDDVDLSIYERDFVGLIGPNGGGKTTLLKVILGLLEPDSGEVKIFGELPREARGKIGYVPQYTDVALDFPIKVQDVVLMGNLDKRKLFCFYCRRDYERVEEVLESVGLRDKAKMAFGELSGGQRQRVMIARALIRDPKLLILDEPTSGVDVQSQSDFFKLLKEINKKAAIIIVSHDVGTISPLINKVGCINWKLYFHDSGEIDNAILESGYKCELELMSHGIPHRVLKKHDD